jgi:flagellar biosynthesis protein FlhF
MRIKKYVAASMKEALLQIKQDLGEDAMILKTRQLPRKLFTLGSQAEVEVTAALDEAAAPRPAPSPITITSPGAYQRPRPFSSSAQGAQPAIPEPVRAAAGRLSHAPAVHTGAAELLELREDIREVKTFIQSMAKPGAAARAGGFDGASALLYRQLVAAEIDTGLAESLVRDLGSDGQLDETALETRFAASIRERFPVAGPLPRKSKGPLTVAFVGPTGGGKTTTLAKLAAHYALERKYRVSIITADTYRIAAIEQIRAFADIVNIGLHVVFTPDEAVDALAECQQSDIVFIDTAGRSQRNSEHMRELSALLRTMRPDQTHLVVSATTKDSDLSDIVERYCPFGVNRLLFTKLDETVRLGNVYNTVNRSRIPASYFTTGQSVPDDIELAQPGRFVLKLRERVAA